MDYKFLFLFAFAGVAGFGLLWAIVALYRREDEKLRRFLKNEMIPELKEISSHEYFSISDADRLLFMENEDLAREGCGADRGD